MARYRSKFGIGHIGLAGMQILTAIWFTNSCPICPLDACVAADIFRVHCEDKSCLSWMRILGTSQAAVSAPSDSAREVGTSGRTVANDVAQTFVPTISGTLSRVGVKASAGGAPSLPLIMDIRTAPGGIPDQSNSSVLGSILVVPSSLPPAFDTQTWTYVDFSSFNIPVSAGTPMTLVLRSNQPYSFPPTRGYLWFASSQGQNIYPAGGTWTRGGGSLEWEYSAAETDLSFQQFVVVPEPSAAVLATLACLAIVACRCFARVKSATRPFFNGQGHGDLRERANMRIGTQC